jgi:hypothetical protein
MPTSPKWSISFRIFWLELSIHVWSTPWILNLSTYLIPLDLSTLMFGEEYEYEAPQWVIFFILLSILFQDPVISFSLFQVATY